MNRSNYPLRLATAGAMFLTIICYFAQGKHPSAPLLIGQIVFGLTTMVLVGCVLFGTVKKVQEKE